MRLWMIPMVYTLLSLAAAMTLPRIEHDYLPGLLHSTSPAAAMAFLTAVASGILAFTAIVFSLAFVMVQFSAMAYSPRLVLMFAGRPTLYHALGIFIATFTYAMATLLWTDRGGDGGVPLISMSLVGVLLTASMISFALLIQSLGSLQITEVLNLVGDEGRGVITDLQAARASQTSVFVIQDPESDPAPAGPPHQTLRYVGVPRSITRIDWMGLAQAAEDSDAVIVLVSVVGDTLVEGAPMLEVHHPSKPLGEDFLRRAIHLGRERTFEQDPQFAFRLLVDIAIKALSPAINDPTTAVQALDQIEDLLRRLVGRDLGSVWITDLQGVRRLYMPLPRWEDYLGLAFDEIRQFGVTSVQVMRRLRAALLGLDTVATRQDRRDAVRSYLAHLDRALELSTLDTQDRASARQVNHQGLGSGRTMTALQADPHLEPQADLPLSRSSG